MKSLQTFGSSPFIDQSYFHNDGAQLYLIFQPIRQTITTFSGLSDTVSKWKSKGLSNGNIEPPFTTNKSLSLKQVWMHNFKIRLRFTGRCLRQEFATFTSNNVINLFIVYELDRWPQDLNAKLTLKDCLEL